MWLLVLSDRFTETLLQFLLPSPLTAIGIVFSGGLACRPAVNTHFARRGGSVLSGEISIKLDEGQVR